MKFVQVVEFKTMRIDEFNKSLDDWMAKTQGSRTPTRGQQTRDRDRQSTCAQIVEFPSHEAAMENSTSPRRQSSPRRSPSSAMDFRCSAISTSSEQRRCNAGRRAGE